MTKQPARPRKPPNRRRSEQIRVMMTSGEKRTVEKAALEADLPVSTFVRKTVLQAVLGSAGAPRR
jgi:hypothetical protein